MAKVFKGLILPPLKPFAWMIVKCILGKLVPFAQDTIKILDSTDLTGEQKRQKAKEKIKEYASQLGVEVWDLAVNLGIELLVALSGKKA